MQCVVVNYKAGGLHLNFISVLKTKSSSQRRRFSFSSMFATLFGCDFNIRILVLVNGSEQN